MVAAPDSIVVTGHRDNAIGTSDAASEGTVTAKLIEDRPALRPGEVLEFVPGVIVTQHSGDGKANQYFLRGFNLDHGTDFATFVAGMPVNMRSHAHGQGYTDLNFLIPELISRINYRKGPYYADDGDFANAGSARILYVHQFQAAVRIRDRRPERLPAAARRGFDGGRPGHAARCARARPQQRALGRARGFPQAERRAALVDGDRRRRLRRHGDGLQREMDRDRPDAEQRGLRWHWSARFGSLDPTDGGKTARASLSLDWTRAIGSGAFQLNAYVGPL